MERSTIIESRIIQAASFDEGEIEVSNILLNLKHLIEKAESRSNRNLDFNSPSTSTNFRVEEESANVEIELKSEAINPEFDHEHKQCIPKNKKSSSKRKAREELMCDIETFTRDRESLKWGLKNVEKHHNNQKAYNLGLKEIRERVMTNSNGQGLGISIGQNFGSSTVQPNIFQYPMGPMLQAQPIILSANGLGFVNYIGPIGTPNLNVTLVEAFTMNSMGLAERKAQYAEARRKRMMKRKKLRDPLV